MRLGLADPADVAGACHAAARAWREVSAELQTRQAALGELMRKHEPNETLVRALSGCAWEIARLRYECERRATALQEVRA